ncbi:30S ribosomal protein S12 methylthiotransferase RimO [uncultured Eubacterium sp.]|mgnify:FL=1|uniref:30S ribosomal protein S12 methylthiotransferase RimO n=1 Tax=uncultured Eubacterium sp. TaxID=165185 RepID=UPI0026720105|nr:30S ribosomal protein S12 methylthiotransferase RimO [uncultured Eubacterium sp.]
MKILLISLGCDKNLVDSEHMSGILEKAGYEFTDNEAEADIIIINSCCFINDAKEESIDTIFEMARYKEEGKCKALVLAGCLAQRYFSQIKEEIPEIDICIGTTAIDSVAKAIDNFFTEKKKVLCLENIDKLAGENAPRNLSTSGSYAYLKIAEGCDKHCTYCIIPKIRGNYRSVKMENILKEAKELAERGVRELILVAQETTMYGKDIYGKKSLHVLLEKLTKISGIYWIRVLYCYPEEIYDELIEVMARESKICNYLDIPIQHASDNVLKRMGRKTNNKQLKSIIQKLRDKIPDIVLRTTLITGFPGETDEDHQKMMEFVDEMEFDRLGVFTYSAEENTPAAEMDNQIDESLKVARRNEIMELQQEIVFEKSEQFIGRKLVAMIEGHISGEHAYLGRTYMDIPGVDSNIFIVTDEELMTGDFVKVKVTGTNDYDFIGELVQ